MVRVSCSRADPFRMMRTRSSRLLPYSLGPGKVHIGEASLRRPWPCARCLVSQNWSWAGLQRSIQGLSLGTMFISVPRLLAAVTVRLNPTGCRGFLIDVTSFPRRASVAGRSLGYAGVPGYHISAWHLVMSCNLGGALLGLTRTCPGIRSRVKSGLGHQDLSVHCRACPISPLSRESSVLPVSSGYESFPRQSGCIVVDGLSVDLGEIVRT